MGGGVGLRDDKGGQRQAAPKRRKRKKKTFRAQIEKTVVNVRGCKKLRPRAVCDLGIQ